MPKVYCLQLDTRWHDKLANYEDVRSRLVAAAPEPGSLVVLPEMFDVGFTMNTDVSYDGPNTIDFQREIARKFDCTILAGSAQSVSGSMTPRRDPLANCAIVVGADGEVVGGYQKCHGFSPAGEHQKYLPGNGPWLFDWAGVKVAPLVCYDLRFPEVFRSAMKQGAELFIIIANWPAARIDHWVTLAKARAIENLAYVVALNRCGSDPHLTYPGQSLVIDPKGKVLAHTDDRPQVMTADIDAELIRGWRREFPALRDARFL